MGVSQKKTKKNENFFDNSSLVRKKTVKQMMMHDTDIRSTVTTVSLHPSQVMKGIGERNPGFYSFIYECLLTEKPFLRHT